MDRRDAPSSLLESFRQHYGELLRFLTRRMGDAERAADVAQDTFLRLQALPAAPVEIDNPRAYLFRVAGNLATDALRREGLRAGAALSDEAWRAFVDPAPSPETALHDRERLRRLDAVVAQLSPKARRALMLNRIDGLSHAEIAERLGVSESMVAKYIGRALRACRDGLRRADGEE